ncbi:sigma 54-interacting transcriptional regulator [Candidatus Sulfidibacterium hydrothermale]|uniref:sigma-54-dependent Fis family transcriptional regulator n=1 Tax=Candidatus Sulfidibacterium hydrothermale TaxID=2875962 RepID=UPI001F0A7291|nr:sigma 54-interacting transcriptional regulator [Candidatus Sulfidibacterium hydrothermale]UBM61497.1 sigma 54-interacting transcriptional regulator [Candidatus Sulfidibacterium hydrothermale]
MNNDIRQGNTDIKDGEVMINFSDENDQPGFNRISAKPAVIFDKERSKKLLNDNLAFIEIAKPCLSHLTELLNKTGFIAILSDKDGIILDVTGEEDVLKKAEKLNLSLGTSFNEKDVGINAIGRAILENKPVQVTGNQHALKIFYAWTCAAAPIHDAKGNILGVLCLAGKKSNRQIHTLGWVISTAKVIENRIENKLVQKQLYDAQYYAFAMMNQLSFGLFAIDKEDKIIWANNTGCRIINIKRSLLINTSINDIFPTWPKVRKMLQLKRDFIDEEHSFNIPGLHENFLFNAYLIHSQENEIIGYQLSFRPFKRFLGLANKYVGMVATHQFDDIFCVSDKMKKIIEYARTVAHSPASILITGESGTGKEVFAQAIHNASERKHGCFVAINCGAISPSLIESELFGYEEGAFTGAVKGGRIGKFEMANGGTLFLDEIGDMPMEMQIKLLRAIQEGQFCRVGGSNVVSVDVRIIAATNKNLEEEIKQNRFRLDLYYRINVVNIKLPALRERKEDIPLLAHYFLETKANKLNKPMVRLSQTLLKEIISYDWPGNIRELENYIEKVTIMNRPVHIQNQIPDETSSADNVDPESDFVLQSLQDMEKQLIERTIKATKINMTQAAKILGIGRNTLYQKIKRYNININEK